LCVIGTLVLGIIPTRVLDYSSNSARELVTVTTTPTESSSLVTQDK
jgi:hypothetical protein